MVDHRKLDRLEELQTEYPAFSKLGTVYVPGHGADTPVAFVVGEAPGAQEQIRRIPFVGPAGIVLRSLMHIAGLRSDNDRLYGTPNTDECFLEPNCWVTNVVKFRPPGNRTPTSREIAAARPFLRMEWHAVGQPPVIVPVGKTALTAIVGRSTSILKVSGKCQERTAKDGTVTYVWPMVHPSFGLRNPAVRPLLERDWEKLGTWLSDNSYL